MAYAPDGNFVIVWSSYGSTGTDTDYGVQARRYLADGSPVGSEFQVNTYTLGEQKKPKVVYQPNGNFIVTWASEESGGGDTDGSVQLQRYMPDGTPLGGDFQVNGYTVGFQSAPDIAVHSDSTFVLVWESNGSPGDDSSSDSIQSRLFAANGSPLGPQMQVNSYTTDGQTVPDVSIAADGSFVVVWNSFGSAGADTDGSIQGQRVGADGTPQGGEFQVNTYTTNLQDRPDVAHTPDGGFVVTWTSNGSDDDTDYQSVHARRYDAAGDPIDDQFIVNTETIGRQRTSELAVAPDGGFIIVWRGDDLDSSGIKGQRFAPDGTPRGSEFQVNSYTPGTQYQTSLALRPDGDFIVSWASEGSPGSDDSAYSIQAQRFAPDIFADGFESGDTDAWSNTVP